MSRTTGRVLSEHDWTKEQRTMVEGLRAKQQHKKVEEKVAMIAASPDKLTLLLHIPGPLAEALHRQFIVTISRPQMGKRMPSRTSLVLELIAEALGAREAQQLIASTTPDKIKRAK